jgi:hypothetical protein
MTTVDTDELVAWLREQLDEDERVLSAASPSPWQYQDVDSVGGGRLCDATVAIAELSYDPPGERIDPRIRRMRTAEEADGNGEHIARWDPARVLAEVEAKRARIDVVADTLECGDGYGAPGYAALQDTTQRLLMLEAQPFASRPGFRDDWRLT